MDYISKLTFTAKPDYEKLIQLFERLMKRKGYSFDSKLEWEEPEFLQQIWPPKYNSS